MWAGEDILPFGPTPRTECLAGCTDSFWFLARVGRNGLGPPAFLAASSLNTVSGFSFFFLLNFERWKESRFLCTLPMHVAPSGLGSETQETLLLCINFGLLLGLGLT